MKKIIQKSRFMLLLVAMMTLSLTQAWGQTYTFTSKAWADATKSWTSDKDGYQYSKPNVQITSACSGAGATSKKSYTDITKISVKASTTSKGIGNITVKVGDGTAQTICSLSKNTTATDYSLEFATPVSGNVTFVVNCSTNSMYMQSITITSATGYDIEYECNGATSGCPEKATNQTALPDPLPTGVQKTGFNFAGWFTNEGLSTPAVAGAEITAKTTLYAKWDEIVTPTVSLDETTLDFGTVYQNAVVSAKTIGATLLNTTSATASITGTAFTLDPTSLTESGKITITPNTATIGEYSETLTLSATGATDAVATITMNVVEAPAPTGVFTKYTAATLVEGDYVICSGTTAMGNTVSSDRMTYTTVTTTGNKVENPEAVNIWHIAPSATEGYWTMYNAAASKYAASTGAKNKIQLLAANTDAKAMWTVSVSNSTYDFVNKQNTTSAVNATLRYNSGMGFACYSTSTGSALTLYAKLGSYDLTKATGIQNGDIDAKVSDATVVGTKVVAGTTVTLSNTPGDGYKLKAYKVFKTDDEETIVAVTDSKFTMPAYAVTISAEFEAAKVLDTIMVSGNYKTEFWKGETFSKSGVVVTAYYNDQTDAEVTSQATFSNPDMTLYNQDQVVTVSYKEGTVTKTTSYNIMVKTIANTQETAYSVDSAIKIITAGKDLATSVYVKGVITGVGELNEGGYFNNLYIKDAGQSNSFQCYKMYKDAQSTAFAEGDLVVGDTIVAYGPIKKYGSTYEFNGCYMVERHAYTAQKKDISNTPETAYTPAKAIELYDDASSDLTKYVYVKGVVKNNPSLTTGGTFAGSYYQVEVTAAETTEPMFTYFHMYNTGGVAFEEDVVGMYDTVMAYGTLAKFNSTYELTNCSMYERKAFVPRVLSVSLNTKATSIAANASVQLTATVLPEEAQDKSVTWSVIEGATYVSVDQTGLVSGLDAGAGTAKVMVKTTDGNFMDTCVVTITASDPRKTASITGFTAVAGALTPSDITYKGEKGGASTAAAIYNNGLRLYQNGGYVTIAAVKGCKIDEVIITTNATYNSTTAAIATTRVKPTSGVSVAASSTKSFGTGMNADTAFVFCLGTTSSTRLELASIVVKYTGEPLAIDTIKVSGDFQTEFEKGADFNHDGAIVTAYYADQVTTAIVTNSATFSEPDMTTTGEKTVTVSYGGKSTSYQITILAATLDTLELSGTYQTIFQQGETFNHDGMVVNAVYSDESKVDVTDDATFSEPDMTTSGQKEVTVSYGGKSTKYTISVKAQSGTMKKETVDFTVVYADVTSNKEVKGYSGVSFEMTCTTAGNSPTKYYANGTAVRSYTGNKIIINAVDSILAIDVKWAEGYEDDAMTIKASADGKSDTLTFSKTCRFTEITVFYQFEDKARTGLSVGQIGTICQGKNILAIRGAVLYNVEYGDAQKITFKEITEFPIAAGTPAVFQAEAADFEVIYGSKTATTAVEDVKDGLVGLVQGNKVAIDEGNILVSGGRLRLVGENCWLTADHAYIDMSEVSPTAPETPAPGRRLVLTNAEAQVVTGLNAAAIKDVEMQKVIMNGQMLIIREGKMYNAQGQMMK